jgi:hypothetical protein
MAGSCDRRPVAAREGMAPRWLGSALLVAALLLGWGGSSRADSDGCYCVGPAYIAYELSLSLPNGGHVLYVVPLGDSAGVGRSISVELPEFQVHGMRCDTSHVELLGWDSLYTARFRGAHPFPVARVAPWVDQGTSRRVPSAYSVSNLGAWSDAAKLRRSTTVHLHLEGARHRFALAIDIKPDPKNDCRQRVRTRLVELDTAQRPIHALTLFSGTAPIECGE